MTKEEKKELLAKLNANKEQTISAMKERANANPNMDPKLREMILKLK